MRQEICDFAGAAALQVAIVNDPSLTLDQYGELTALPVRGRVSGQTRFVAIGRLVAQKNFGLMLRSFANGAKSRDQLTIVGDGPDRKRLQRLARSLGIAAQVNFVGYDPSTSKWLAQSDVYLMSSDYEGVPAVIIEALAAGKRIIATSCSVSMSALLGEGRLGQLVAVGDQAGLAAAIGSAALLQQDERGARALAREFTVDRAARSYLHLFGSILPQPGAASIKAPHAVRTTIA